MAKSELDMVTMTGLVCVGCGRTRVPFTPPVMPTGQSAETTLGRQAFALFESGKLTDVTLVCQAPAVSADHKGASKTVGPLVPTTDCLSLDDDDHDVGRGSVPIAASVLERVGEQSSSHQGEWFAAHRFILAARSSTFRSILATHAFEESKTRVIHVHDCAPKTLAHMLEWMYSEQWPRDLDGSIWAPEETFAERFNVGDTVQATWQGGSKVYFNVIVKGTNADGTYCARYHDGEVGHGVFPFEIVARDDASLTSLPSNLSTAEAARRDVNKALWTSLADVDRAKYYQWSPCRVPAAAGAATAPATATATATAAAATVAATTPALSRNLRDQKAKPVSETKRRATSAETKDIVGHDEVQQDQDKLCQDIVHLLMLAHRFDLALLVDECVHRLTGLIAIRHVSGLLVIADRLQLPALEDRCWAFLKSQCSALRLWTTHESYADLSKDIVTKTMLALCSSERPSPLYVAQATMRPAATVARPAGAAAATAASEATQVDDSDDGVD